jgi:hypothetical protein
MLFRLNLHADSNCPSVSRIDVELTRLSSAIGLRYLVTGSIAELSLPRISTPRRADGLWRHTCCEAFIAATESPYYEFNFSPSTEWAAYRFNAYREGMTPCADVPEPKIELRNDSQAFELKTTVDLTPLRLAPKLRIGLATIIEERSGRISYWALAHPSKTESAKPDFHHASSFIDLET